MRIRKINALFSLSEKYQKLAELSIKTKFQQQFSIRIRIIVNRALDISLYFLYKTLRTCNRISGVYYELPLSIRFTSFDFQPSRGTLSLNR